ncbi:hypothetical protein C0J52_19162 [Blattella germanica]|nr:hypothetical protein C0J52_19162 [Blattella germanica]
MVNTYYHLTQRSNSPGRLCKRLGLHDDSLYLNHWNSAVEEIDSWRYMKRPSFPEDHLPNSQDYSTGATKWLLSNYRLFSCKSESWTTYHFISVGPQFKKHNSKEPMKSTEGCPAPSTL